MISASALSLLAQSQPLIDLHGGHVHQEERGDQQQVGSQQVKAVSQQQDKWSGKPDAVQINNLFQNDCHYYGKYIIGTWNLCGFNSTVNHEYTEFKRSVIASVYFDILIITETHCIRDELVTIDNYIVYQFNRTGQDTARRGSGGVAIAVHTSVLDTHVVVAVDKGRDGQLSIKLNPNYPGLFL